MGFRLVRTNDCCTKSYTVYFSDPDVTEIGNYSDIYQQNQIVFTIFQLIWNQTDVRLVPNQSENGKYNLILLKYVGIDVTH